MTQSLLIKEKLSIFKIIISEICTLFLPTCLCWVYSAHGKGGRYISEVLKIKSGDADLLGFPSLPRHRVRAVATPNTASIPQTMADERMSLYMWKRNVYVNAAYHQFVKVSVIARLQGGQKCSLSESVWLSIFMSVGLFVFSSPRYS